MACRLASIHRWAGSAPWTLGGWARLIVHVSNSASAAEDDGRPLDKELQPELLRPGRERRLRRRHTATLPAPSSKGHLALPVERSRDPTVAITWASTTVNQCCQSPPESQASGAATYAATSVRRRWAARRATWTVPL